MTDPTASGTASNLSGTAAAAPGWYPDGSGTQRWWDGQGWTDHVAPHVAPAAASTAPLVRPALPEGTKVDTVWTWLLATITWISVIPIFFFDYVGYFEGLMTGNVGGPVTGFFIYSIVLTLVSWGAYALNVVAGYRDYKHLLAVGVVRPFHWAFAFLGSLVYLIGRHVILRKVSRTPGWPLWLYLALTVVYLIAITVWSIVLMQQLVELFPDYLDYYSGYSDYGTYN